jgi:hypothetical protein
MAVMVLSNRLSSYWVVLSSCQVKQARANPLVPGSAGFASGGVGLGGFSAPKA